MYIRAASSTDIDWIYKYVQRKAEFDQCIGAYQGELKTSHAKIKTTIFGPKPFAYVIFVEQNNRPVGFALYGFRYSSFSGQPSIWLDDLYVDEKFRSQGAGTMLMQHLAQIASSHSCTHIAWTADARNYQGIRFYQRLGAEITEQKTNRYFWHWMPLTSEV